MSAPAPPVPSGPASSAGPFGPLRVKLFRALWLAAIASNIGTWIQSVGEKWQMAELTKSPFLISLIETGTTLPMLLLALSAGAIADIVDRRKLLIVAQTYMMLVAATLSVVTFLHLITPFVLLTMSLLIGVGSAVTGPAWQASVPEILPRKGVPAGVALNSAGYNVSRAVGPALGGLVVGALGPAFAFLLNAVSFLGTVLVLLSWNRVKTTQDLPAERFLGAISLGLRYVRYSRQLQVILVRAFGFVIFAGVIFSLTPSLAIHRLHLSSSAFGFLLGAIGAGAVTATTCLPYLRSRLSPNTLFATFTALTAAALLVLAFIEKPVPVAVALFVCGGGWLSVLSTLNTAIQLSVPSWVRARAFGAYITTWGGAMAIGAALWGAVAERRGLPFTFTATAVGMLMFLAATGRLRVQALYQELDLTPFRDRPHPPEPIEPETGPILVELRYRIPRGKSAGFRDAMRAVRRIRIRDGAIRWSLFEEPSHGEEPIEFLESFLSSTWGEHLRQHHRATKEDREILQGAYALDPDGKPRVEHLVAAWETLS